MAFISFFFKVNFFIFRNPEIEDGGPRWLSLKNDGLIPTSCDIIHPFCGCQRKQFLAYYLPTKSGMQEAFLEHELSDKLINIEVIMLNGQALFTSEAIIPISVSVIKKYHCINNFSHLFWAIEH